MFNYIKGKVTIIESNMIVIENGGIFYTVYIANP